MKISIHDQIPHNTSMPRAMVVGLCAHGLDLIRALVRHRIPVHALEANRNLPGARTRLAQKHFVDDINSEGLVDELISLRSQIDSRENPVLFLTNDNMVLAVAENLSRLSELYRVSWNDSYRAKALLLKSSLGEHCARAKIPYPRSYIVEEAGDLERLGPALQFPIITKPVMPLSGFKADLVQSVAELQALLDEHPTALPVVVQSWIPGDVTRIRFCALYCRRGEILGRFEGRKLGSLPEGRGVTTAAEQWTDDALFEQTRKFFEDLEISGPVSLEVKKAEDGTLWTIEPTLFRSDYWLGCCVANGVNFPLIEYCEQTGIPGPEHRQQPRAIWIDLERDPASMFKALRRSARNGRPSRRLALTYLHWKDPVPLLMLATGLLRRAMGKIRRTIWRALVRDETAR